MKKTRIRLSIMLVVLLLGVLSYVAGPMERSAWFSWQFSPALAAMGWTTFYTVFFIVLAVVFGGIYCSVLCPAGIVQELAFKAGKAIRLSRVRYKRGIRYWPLLIAAAITLAMGFAGLANLLDPVGWFGRLTAPVVEFSRDMLYGSDYAAGYYGIAGLPIILATVLLVLVPVFSGRWFCDRLCPVGAVLGTFASLSRKQIQIDRENCTSCHACEKACPARCINSGKREIEAERCVLCLECLDSCPMGAISHGSDFSASRRRAIASGLAWMGTLAFLSARSVRAGILSFANRVGTVLPPGAVNADRYFQKCIGCQSCSAACPVGIIKPMLPGAQPELRFDLGFCQYECNACSLSCPSGALTPLSVDDKKRTRLAKTSFSLEKCVVITEGTACGACAEICPVHALVMVEQGGDLPPKPEYHPEHCIGCGACLYVCPARPTAFQIAGLVKHELANPPRNEPSNGDDMPKDSGGAFEFPF
jgi:ferredoxin